MKDTLKVLLRKYNLAGDCLVEIYATVLNYSVDAEQIDCKFMGENSS
jgi:hypothetical protein